jgi:hypothetical protein
VCFTSGPALQRLGGDRWGRASCWLFAPHQYYEKGQTMAADIGEIAPDFTLPAANNETIGLAQFRGQKHVILSFHVFNFTSG